MSAPNDFRFTSSNKEKVALLINRKQGENYHMRPVKTRHTWFSVIVTTAVRAREVDNPQVQGIIVAIPKGGSDKYGVSNPQGAKGKINILSSPICH